jgi:hypothetical protein
MPRAGSQRVARPNANGPIADAAALAADENTAHEKTRRAAKTAARRAQG